MAKLKIYQYPDIVLSQKAVPIARVEKTLFPLADDMLETMYGAPGIGLAANQVGILQRILVIDVDYETADEDLENEDSPENTEVVGAIFNQKPRILINPVITYQEGHILHQEGCLSVPDYYADVRRAEKIKVTYQTIDGITETLSADGLLAVAVQHEMDHLDGKLFIDRLSPLKKEMARKKLKQVRKDEQSSRRGKF